MSKILNFFSSIATSNLEGGYESEPVRKAIVINLFSLIGIVFMLYFGFQTLVNYKVGYSFILFGFSVLTASVFIYLRITKNYLNAGYGIVLLMTVLEIYFIVSGGVENTAILWFYVYPILCLFTLGIKRGIYFILFLLVITLFLFITKPDFFPDYNYNFTLRFISTYIAVTLMAITFEFVREATYKTMLEADQKKTFYLNKVLEQQKELEQHKSNLERMVHERTAELEIAKLKAEESDKLKSAFLANMSHEIRTPMNAIIGFSTLITESDTDPDLKRQMSVHLINSTNSLLNLLDNIIDLSKIESGQMQLNYSQSNISSILNELFIDYKNKLDESLKQNISFYYDNVISIDEISFISDPYRVRQIMSSLLDNAIKFTDEGEIRFGYQLVKVNEVDYCKLYVKDTGIGLSDEQKKYIFKRFTKAETDRKKLYRGAGLGLSICKSLVLMLNGDIWFESESGKGSVFYFTIPINQIFKTNSAPKEKPIPIETNWENKTILIADDEEDNLIYLKRILQKTKANLFYVENGLDAVEFVKNNHVDLILMDIKMPVMNGLEATRIIKEMNRNIPIIALTAFALENNEKITIDTGCDAYLAKPLEKTDIIFLIKEFL